MSAVLHALLAAAVLLADAPPPAASATSTVEPEPPASAAPSAPPPAPPPPSASSTSEPDPPGSRPPAAEAAPASEAAPPAGDAPPSQPRQDPRLRPCPDPGAEPGPGEHARGNGWVDVSHERLERGLNELVLRLDRFFGDSAHQPFEPPTSRIRIRSEVRSAEDDSLEGRTGIAADLRLPAADRMLSRFSLLITGESEADPTRPDSAAADRDPPRFDARVRAAGGALELRYDVFRARRTLVDVGAGARAGLPPPPFTRLRVAQGFPLGASVLGHATQSLFWDRLDGFGETTRLDVERSFGSRTLARWWSIGTVDERSRGYEWASEVGVQRALGRRTGIYPAAAIAGATRSIAKVDNYRVFTRLRRDVHDGWAFLEVEPELAWPADEAGHRSRALGIILRLELQFSTDGRKDDPLCNRPSPQREPPRTASMS